MDYTQQIAAYKQMVNQLVGSKVSEESIDPGDVAALGIQLADLLLPILNSINDFAITGGTIPPNDLNGTNLDLYIQGGTSLNFWRKRNGIWNIEASVDLGIQIIDGNITLQASVSGNFATVTAGTWAINNVIYNKPTQTQFSLTAADLNFDRIDALVADTNSAITLVTGVASSNPAAPVKPANAIIVSYVYVPSSSSGNLPYIANSNVPIAPPVIGAIIDDETTSLTKTWSSQKINDAINQNKGFTIYKKVDTSGPSVSYDDLAGLTIYDVSRGGVIYELVQSESDLLEPDQVFFNNESGLLIFQNPFTEGFSEKLRILAVSNSIVPIPTPSGGFPYAFPFTFN